MDIQSTTMKQETPEQKFVVEKYTPEKTQNRRVGTFTLGLSMICVGLFFLINIFLPTVGYTLLLKLWPFVFIFLGAEILIACFQQEEHKLIYDKTAIILVFVLTVFGMCMAFLAQMVQYGLAHISVS